MKRIEGLIRAAGKRPHKELVQAIAHQTCLKRVQVQQLLRVLDLEKAVSLVTNISDRPQPTILMEALTAPDPVALAIRAIEEEWTAEQTRLEAARLKANNGGPPTSPPVGRYRVVVVDPPWSYGNISGRHGADYAPRMMALDEVARGQFAPERNIRDWFAEDWCHLYLWVTDAYAGDVYQVVRAWGFDPKAWLVWVKDRIGMGNYYRHQHEFCVFAVRGKQRLLRMDASTVFRAPVTRHSAKPDAFYSLVESCSPGPYLDVFGRQLRAGWDVYGDEVTTTYQLPMTGRQESQQIS